MESKIQIFLAADHGGFELKEFLKQKLISRDYATVDLGTNSEESVHYPDFASILVNKILQQKESKGILICSTGIGMSITANRYKGIRASLCHDHLTAKMSRQHNNSNVLVLGGKLVGQALALEILDTWLETSFEGGRHSLRIEKIDNF